MTSSAGGLKAKLPAHAPKIDRCGRGGAGSNPIDSSGGGRGGPGAPPRGRKHAPAALACHTGPVNITLQTGDMPG